jgi:hypothetical protein
MRARSPSARTRSVPRENELIYDSSDTLAGMRIGTLGTLFVMFAVSCSSDTQMKADLPAGWESAKLAESFSQARCSGSAEDPSAPPEAVDVTAAAGSINVAYHNAHFRCEQLVQGFVRVESGGVDVLVQPTDMNPSSVAACDCLYEIKLFESVAAGPTTVTVYRRWDHAGGNPNDPVTVGTANVTVP